MYNLIFNAIEFFVEIGVFSGLLNLFLNRFERRQELLTSKQIEAYKDILTRKNYISKVRFDKEFAIYQDISEKLFDLVQNCMQLFPFTDFLPLKDNGDVDEQRVKEKIEKRYIKANDSFNAARRTIEIIAPFIPIEFYNRFKEITDMCIEPIVEFESNVLDYKNYEHLGSKYGKNSKLSMEINKKRDELYCMMREYITSLDVYE